MLLTPRNTKPAKAHYSRPDKSDVIYSWWYKAKVSELPSTVVQNHSWLRLCTAKNSAFCHECMYVADRGLLTFSSKKGLLIMNLAIAAERLI